MKRIANLSKITVVFLFCCFGKSSAVLSEELPWTAGVAKMIITPEEQVWLAGYGYKREPEGRLHDLWVKALALEDSNGLRSVIVTTDLMGIPRYMYESISRKLMDRFHLERSQILLTFSHNHCAPRLHEDLVDYYPKDSVQIELVREYSDNLEEKIIETVAFSLSDLSPARLMIGEGTASFAVNRRNNVESEVPELLAADVPLEGPVDHSVPIMAIYKEDNQLVAIMFGYACHPTTLNFEKWCGDYPGFAQIELEKNHPGIMALFFTGCGGDQNPLPRREVLLCEQYGSRLSEAVEKALQCQLKPVPSKLSTAFEFVDLDYLSPPSRKELETALLEHQRDTSARARIRASWAERMLEKMDAGEQFASFYSYPVQVWKLGGIFHWISLGGEAVVDYSLRFKKEFGPNTWVCGYANVLVAYIPSLRVYNEGGYEGGAFLYEYGLPANRWASDVEERVTDAVHRLVRNVR
jgi:neutral ceramidase